MKKKALLLMLILSNGLSCMAQDVTVEARIDSMMIFIGEQTGVTFTVSAPESLSVQLPAFEPRQMLTPGVEVVEIEPDDTVRSAGSKTIRRKLLITSFDENAYKIPEQTIKVGGREYKTNPLALKVLTVDVDTLNLDKFFPPKDVQDNPFLWSDWSALFWLSCIMFCLILIVIYKV